MGQVEFQAEDHLACLWEGRSAVRKRSAQQAEEALVATIVGDSFRVARRLQRAIKTGAWLAVQPSTVNGT